MKFWDSSAVVALCLDEPHTNAVRAVVSEDPSLVVWWATRVECVSAIVRRTREGMLGDKALARAQEILDRMALAWFEVLPNESLRATAERVLSVHHLRAGDALQLAASLAWRKGDPAGAAIVSYDRRLREAASREGFDVLPGA